MGKNFEKMNDSMSFMNSSINDSTEMKNKLSKLDQMVFRQKAKINELTREADLSKSINQTLITLLKWKNIEIEHIKEDKKVESVFKNPEESKRAMEKFKKQEKTLLDR